MNQRHELPQSMNANTIPMTNKLSYIRCALIQALQQPRGNCIMGLWRIIFFCITLCVLLCPSPIHSFFVLFFLFFLSQFCALVQNYISRLDTFSGRIASCLGQSSLAKNEASLAGRPCTVLIKSYRPLINQNPLVGSRDFFSPLQYRK